MLLLSTGRSFTKAAVVDGSAIDTASVPSASLQQIALRSDTLVITEQALRDHRFFAWDIVTSVPGIDLMKLGHPRYSLEDRADFATRGYDDAAWPALDSTAQAGLSRGKVVWVRFAMVVPTTSVTSGMLEQTSKSSAKAPLEVYLNDRITVTA
ncbi:MAG: hypothetical protein IPO60_12240 [Flavobacteriales bacterium]|nr:hypothetical protein [Flavobacteriales bacterium]